MQEELFDGEIRAEIEDDENIPFRRPNPATPGSRVISGANFKAFLRNLFVWLGNVNQSIDGIKTFLKSPVVPDPTSDLEAVNLRTLLSNTNLTPNSIKFNTSYEPIATQEGELFWNGKWHTLEYDTGLGASIRVGKTLYDVFYNNTGATIPALSALHLKSAVLFNSELYPTFELADASDYEKIQGTIAISCCDVLDGALGVCVRDATKIKGDTSAWPSGSQLWVSDDGSGSLTNIKPEFPSASISVGGNYNQESAPNGEVFVNITSTFGDIFHESWDGSVIESFDFLVASDGVNVVGTLSNVNPLLDLTLNFSDGTFRLDTTTSPLTIALTPGTDDLEITNYVYIPKSTKALTLSTNGWPTTEHVRIAQLELQSAATTQVDGGALGNQNINDHIKKEGDNGHILHITSWIRKQFCTWDSGSEATFDNTGGNGYILITGGVANQLHEQSLSSFSMIAGDQVRVWNDFSGNRPKLSNLSAITAYSNGSSWNNQWGKIVVWRGVNKSGEYSPVMINLPSNGYNSESAALADLSNYADYSIPNNFKTKAILIAAFTFRISGGAITYISGYEDLRGTIPISTAGGGAGGGAGATTYLALTDTPSTRVGKAGNVVVVNAGESADEYEPKSWFWNAARTFYTNIVSLATSNRTLTLADADLKLHKDNITATTAPTANNDSSQAYSVGSTWIDITNDNVYKCVDANVGAAVWEWLNEKFVDYDLSFAISDETSDLTTDNDGSIKAIRAQTIQSITFAVNTAPTGSSMSVDVLKNGTTILTTPISLAASSVSVTITSPQINVIGIAGGDIIKAVITQVGATIAGAGAKIYFKTELV